MMEEKYEKLLAEFITKNEPEKKDIEAAIQTGELEYTQVNEIKSFCDKLSALPEPEPSDSLRSNFYQMLAQEKQKEATKNNWRNSFLNFYQQLLNIIPLGKLAYSLVLLSLGGALGIWYNQSQNAESQRLAALTSEMQQMKKMMMLTLLEQPSATDRLKAVNLTSDMKSADNKVIQALLQTLNYDPSVNVRLAAIEALYQHADNSVAREGLVHAISKQDSPLVQLALADIMVAMQEKDSVKQLKELLQKDNLNEAVKIKVKQSIQVLI
jgi:hypothetical protein